MGACRLRAPIKVNLTSDYFALVGSWSIQLSNDGELSNEVMLQVIPGGLPPAPVITSVTPSQLQASVNPEDTWITIQRANFVAGDTIIKAAFEDPASPSDLEVQVDSPTQLEILIPAEWQSAPFSTTLHAESSQDPQLQSGDVEFDILDSSGISTFDVGSSDSTTTPLIPLSMDITSVGDGFVPLAATGATENTTIHIYGGGFEPGANVVVDVDGAESQLPATVLSDSEVKVEIPPALFGIKAYKFAIQLQLQGGNPAAGQPQAQQQAVATKVVFDNQSRYAKGKLFNLGGFHKRNTHASNNSQDDLFLMVKEPTPSRSQDNNNPNLARIPKDIFKKSSGQQITFDADLPNVISPQPAVAQSAKQPLTVTFQGTDQAAPTNLKANLSNIGIANAPRSVVGTLQVQLMHARVYNVGLYFVTGKAPTNSAQQSCTKLPLAPTRLKDWQKNTSDKEAKLAQALTEIWSAQANVRFNVHVVQGSGGSATCQGSLVPWPFVYDKNNDGALRKNPHTANSPDNPEIQAITSQIPVPAPDASTADGTLNVYFVHQFEPALQINTYPSNSTSGYVNVPYKALFGAVGGLAPYTWTVVSGLPSGWVFSTNSDGTFSLSGTPTQVGTISLQVRVSDADSPSQVATVNVNVPVAGTPQHPPSVVGPNPLAPPKNTQTAGFATDIGDHTIFMNDATAEDIFVHVLAHEIGHALGLNHMSEPAPNYTDPNADTTCTHIPGLLHTDTDFSDRSALMWWFTYHSTQSQFHHNQSHIGIRNWTQLNTQNSNQACQ